MLQSNKSVPCLTIFTWSLRRTLCSTAMFFSSIQQNIRTLRTQKSSYTARSCLVPVRLSPRPPKSIHFGDVSETNGLGTRVFARSLNKLERGAKNGEKKQRGAARREKAPPPPIIFLAVFRAARLTDCLGTRT